MLYVPQACAYLVKRRCSGKAGDASPNDEHGFFLVSCPDACSCERKIRRFVIKSRVCKVSLTRCIALLKIVYVILSHLESMLTVALSLYQAEST
jgi:hypothetical protein